MIKLRDVAGLALMVITVIVLKWIPYIFAHFNPNRNPLPIFTIVLVICLFVCICWYFADVGSRLCKRYNVKEKAGKIKKWVIKHW